jgi:hypothetical protein
MHESIVVLLERMCFPLKRCLALRHLVLEPADHVILLFPRRPEQVDRPLQLGDVPLQGLDIGVAGRDDQSLGRQLVLKFTPTLIMK